MGATKYVEAPNLWSLFHKTSLALWLTLLFLFPPSKIIMILWTILMKSSTLFTGLTTQLLPSHFIPIQL